MHKVYLSLGSNMGDKVDYLDKAVDMIQKNEDIHNVKVSSYYQTDPVGYLDQDVFVNIAIELETELTPLEMLDLCQHVEETLNRVRVIRWGPRTIDVDIILYDGIDMESERLILPHPRAYERAFVLVPMAELNDELIIHNQTITELMKVLDTAGVRKL